MVLRVAHDELRLRPRRASHGLAGTQGAATLSLGVVVDGVGILFSPKSEVNTVAHSLRVSVVGILLVFREGRPADLESGLRLVAIFVNPEALGLVVLPVVRIHVAVVPLTSTGMAIVTGHGVLVATAVIAPGRGYPRNADGIVVGREQGVHTLVIVVNVDCA
ncbi:uncharacterized protein N7515_007783 [Penicillium bovifimosum]|uniref:Uncharacterized protein n=1 Tax=Penicillium bovifimosum TaxID=126998 RepID=A0A9W9GLY7_9EURO|nr:uncharacterized protein N7515_007783 [Penicillium bovifimosum]KAJ5123958.1 hypothetical protein N7515_007783 [Penicillium bovifimosum]